MRSDFLVHPTAYTRLGSPPMPNLELLRIRYQSHLNQVVLMPVTTSPYKYLQQEISNENTELTLLLTIDAALKPRSIQTISIDEQ